MYIMVSVTYPAHKSEEVSRVAREIEDSPIPPFMERLNAFVRRDLEYGIRSWSFYKIEKGKEEEGLIVISQRLGKNDNIEGYRWGMQIVYSVPEIMAAQAAQTG